MSKYTEVRLNEIRTAESDMHGTTIRKRMTMAELNALDDELYELFGTRQNIIAFFGITAYYEAEVLVANEEYALDIAYEREREAAWEAKCQAEDEIEMLFDEPESEYDDDWFESHDFEWDVKQQQWYDPDDTLPNDDEWDAEAIGAQCEGTANNTAIDIATIEEFTMDYSFGADNRLFEADLNSEFAKYNY